MAFNLPQSQTSQTQLTGCPPGYVLIDGACVNPLVEVISESAETVQYDFVYYENAGEMVGKYKFQVIGNFPVPPIYFDQNVVVVKYKDIEITNTATVLNGEDGVLSMGINHRYNSGVPEIDVEIQTTDILDEEKYSFSFGEFHLLSNNPSSIKRINLNYDLIYNDENHTSILPKPIESEPNPVAKWYLDFGILPVSNRPDNMLTTNGPLTPTLANQLSATNNLSWKTLQDTCYRTIRIYDGTNINELIQDIPKNGFYLMKIRCVVDEVALQDLMNNSLDSSVYTDGVKRYDLLFYPPSTYSFPADSVSTISSPRINATNLYMNQIIFDTPNNYKTDGNVQYMIQFLTAKNSTDILFETSSCQSLDSFESIEWSISEDGKSWKTMTPGLPTFNNLFEESNGSDSEKTFQIRYDLSAAAKLALEGRADIVFKIKQIDGTLIF